MAPRPATAPATSLVDFGSDSQFLGGMGIPEGRYALYFDLMMHRFMKQDGTPGRGPEQLKMRVTAYAIDESGVSIMEKDEEPKYGYYGLGSKAHLSFAPEPKTGKSLVPIPGGTATKFNDQTNYALFRAALRNCGMPDKFFTGDLTVLDGMWARMTHVPEPEGRKALRGSKTADTELEDENRGPQTISVPLEVLEGGRPWEGEAGGVLEAAPVATKRPTPGKPAPAPAAGPKPVAARPATRPAPAPVVEEEAADEEDVATVATNAIAEFFEDPKNAKGAAKAVLRTYVFRTVSDKVSPEMGQSVLDAYFEDATVLATLLEPFGFAIAGAMLKPKA